ncbi:PAS domain-containing protein [Yinghuangia aomiensis]
MYVIFDRDPICGPLRLDDLPCHVLPGDLPAVQALVTGLLDELVPVEGEFRLLRRDGTTRSVRLVGEPVLNADGTPPVPGRSSATSPNCGGRRPR